MGEGQNHYLVQTMLDPHEIKKDFPLLNGSPLVYLDNGATSQKPQVVLDAMNEYYTKNNANVHRGLYALSEKATAEYEGARKVIADFIQAEAEEVIFQKGATEGLNHVARLLAENVLKKGDTILLSVSEHHSNIVPWQMVAKKHELKLSFLPVTDEGRFDLNVFEQEISKAKVLSVQYVSNVTGVIHPVAKMIQTAKKYGVITILDACQAAPHMALDVKKLDCDFLVFSAHKMLGPTGFGVLYGKKEWLEKLEPVFGGGDMIKEVHQEYSTWNDLPWKFEPGTPPIAEAIGTKAAVQYLQNVGWENLHEAEQKLTAYTLEKLAEIPQVRIIGPKDMKDRIGVISFTIANIHPHDIAQVLDQHNVAIRAGHHCAQPLMEFFNVPATARMSLYLYNTQEDVDRCVAAIRAVIKLFN